MLPSSGLRVEGATVRLFRHGFPLQARVRLHDFPHVVFVSLALFKGVAHVVALALPLGPVMMSLRRENDGGGGGERGRDRVVVGRGRKGETI